MKYLLVLLLGLILGALAYRQIDVTRTPAADALGAMTDPSAPAPVAGNAGDAPARQIEATTATIPAAAPVAQPVIAATPSPIPVAPDPQLGASGLLIPVQGKLPADLADTFTDARSQGRSHDAIDIMASAGTPVLAVADGQVEKLFTSERGGLTIYQFEPSGKIAYYYAHLQAYADGLAEKQTLKRGQVIGYVGSTGNASPQAPHLHFAIFMLGPERRWWEGAAINPYPLLAGKR